MFEGALLSGKTNGATEVPKEAMEVLAPVLDTMLAKREMGLDSCSGGRGYREGDGGFNSRLGGRFF